jgi:hypothetical protein
MSTSCDQEQERICDGYETHIVFLWVWWYITLLIKPQSRQERMFMHKHTQQEALAIIRDVAQDSHYYNRRKLWYAHNLVSGKPKHRKFVMDWALFGFLAVGFLCALFMNNRLS